MYESKISKLQEALKNLESSNAEIESAFGSEFVAFENLEEAKRLKREIASLEAELKEIASAQEAIANILGKFLFFDKGENCWCTGHQPVCPKGAADDSLSFYTETKGIGCSFQIKGVYYVDDDMHTQRVYTIADVTLKGNKIAKILIDRIQDLITVITSDDAYAAAFRVAELKWVVSKLTKILENDGYKVSKDTARDFSGRDRKIIVS